MSAAGRARSSDRNRAWSVHPLITDLRRKHRHVRFVPNSSDDPPARPKSSITEDACGIMAEFLRLMGLPRTIRSGGSPSKCVGLALHHRIAPRMEGFRGAAVGAALAQYDAGTGELHRQGLQLRLLVIETRLQRFLHLHR